MADTDLSEREQIILSVTKFASMILMMTLVAIFGTLPIKIRAFKLDRKVLAFMGAFTGGLFISIALILLLPRASHYFDLYYDDNKVHYPMAYFVSIISFSVIMFIEKVAPDHQDYQFDEEVKKDQTLHNQNQNQLLVNQAVDYKSFQEDQNTETQINSEDDYKRVVSTQLKIANKLGYIQNLKSSRSVILKRVNQWSPYVLQLAIGIQAIMEGLALGISQNIPNCIGLAIAISCHKWAEGLTLGYSFRQAKIKRQRAGQLIILQSLMSPIGIGIIYLIWLAIGWTLSYEGALVKAIIYSIAAGPYIYISSVDILQEEFNIARYKWQKYVVSLLAIAFVCGIWFFEQNINEQ